jgi:SAM-dependent methyltransferase
MTTPRGSTHWDLYSAPFRAEAGGRWRDFCDEIHLRLIDELLPTPGPVVLKTDLFDEAAGTGLVGEISRLRGVSRLVGVDISTEVVAAALGRDVSLTAVAGDLRQLPYRAEAFDTIISNSSLDHFETRGELIVAIDELYRVTRPGGALLITLDNLACPVILLRAKLPYRLLHRLGILSYPVGATLTPRGLRRALVDAGFVVESTTTFMHVPRIIAIPACRRLDRRQAPNAYRTIRRLLAWERLRRFPTRTLTGHFVAVVARRPSS